MSNKYFKYLYILMKYAFSLKRRRFLAYNFIELEYESIKWAIINDETNKRLVCFLYEEKNGFFEYMNVIRIYGYYPRQVRKILYTITEKIKKDGDYKKIFLDRGLNVSKSRAESFKRFKYVQNLRGIK